jgi:hypothetical protein
VRLFGVPVGDEDLRRLITTLLHGGADGRTLARRIAARSRKPRPRPSPSFAADSLTTPHTATGSSSTPRPAGAPAAGERAHATFRDFRNKILRRQHREKGEKWSQVWPGRLLPANV